MTYVFTYRSWRRYKLAKYIHVNIDKLLNSFINIRFILLYKAFVCRNHYIISLFHALNTGQGCFYAKTILTEHISLETTTDISAKNITRTER